MFRRVRFPVASTHGSLLRRELQGHRRLSHSLSSPDARRRDRRLGVIDEEVEELQSLMPNPPRRTERPRAPEEAYFGGGGGRRKAELSNPWPEWSELMDLLLKKRYLGPASSSSSMDSNHIRTACLNFARDRFDLIRYFSRRDIQVIVESGCPSIDRKVVNSGKRLRAHVGIEEGDVCSSCDLRGRCERAFVKARESESERTVDIMRILLTHGLDVITGSIGNQACMSKTVEESVRKLLSEMVKFGLKDLDSSSSAVTSGKFSSRTGKADGHQVTKGPIAVPTRQGDWNCPKCNFLNFAKNIKCLSCNGFFQERLRKLHEDNRHLPLKKGDWICEKCNFLNFAKNIRCLQCHEKPPRRQLSPGDWECVSCNYINFQRNMVCLKCDWRRPKASNIGDSAVESRNRIGTDKHLSVPSNNSRSQNYSPEDEETDFWSSSEDHGGDDEDLGASNIDLFDNFPIVGGKRATSQDPLARERWKEEMLRRSQSVSGKSSSDEKHDNLASPYYSNLELDESSGEDDIAGWFSSDGHK